MAPDIMSSFGIQCGAGLCIYYADGNLISVNYITGYVAWNVMVPFPILAASVMNMLPNLTIVTGSTGIGTSMVLGIDPTSGKFWTQVIGHDKTYLLLQRGSSQVLLGTSDVLELANVF